MDGNRLEQETGIKWEKMFLNDSDLLTERPVTIKQVFKYTPEAGDAIDAFMTRKNDWMFQSMVGKDCNERFSVSKLLTS